MNTTEDPFQKIWTSLLDRIDRYGWAVQSVMATAEAPPYAYSVGMCKLGKPEVLILGLDYETSHQLINDICERLVQGLATAAHGEVLEQVANFPLRVCVPPEGRTDAYALGAQRYAQEFGHEVKVVQVLWPDPEGRFTDDPLCEQHTIWLQQLNPQDPRKDLH